jgi:hypothetical protein
MRFSFAPLPVFQISTDVNVRGREMPRELPDIPRGATPADDTRIAQLRGRVDALEELLHALRPTVEAACRTQWGAALRDLNHLVPEPSRDRGRYS